MQARASQLHIGSSASDTIVGQYDDMIGVGFPDLSCGLI